MNSIPYIDIHTHNPRAENDVVFVRNIFPSEAIPAFTGKNFVSVGLHPWKITTKKENDDLLLEMKDALRFDHVIFIGECGPDKFSKTDFVEQLRVFKAQAFMAEEIQKPLIIHCGKAYNEVIEVFNEIKPSVPWIFHGYNGSPELTEQLAGKNCMFSFGELLFKEETKAINSFKSLPLEKIFFETDDSAHLIKDVYERGAELKNLSLKSLKEAVWKNFNQIENVSFNT